MTRREFIRKAFGLGALGAVGGATGALTMAKLSAEAWKQALDRVCRFVVAHGGELRELELIKLLPPVRSPWDRELREFVFVTARHRTPLLP